MTENARTFGFTGSFSLLARPWAALGGLAKVLLLPALTLLQSPLAMAMEGTEELSKQEARRENAKNTGVEQIAQVDHFTGNFTSTLKEIAIPGPGGLDIEIYRRFDGNNVRSNIWPGEFWGSTGSGMHSHWAIHYGWSLNAAPSVLINVAFRSGSNSYDGNMYDWSDKVCMGQPWRDANGRYGDIVLYSVSLPNGQEEQLVPTATGVVTTRSGWKLTCEGGQGGVHILRSPTGRKFTLGKKAFQRSFSQISYTESVSHEFLTTRQEDLNGNWIDYAYTDVGTGDMTNSWLTAITASDGRTVSLAYDDNAAWGKQLKSISTHTGATWHYRYDSVGSLVEVENPVAETFKYEYYPRLTYDPKIQLVTGLATHAQPDWAIGGQIKKIQFPQGGTVTMAYAPSEVWYRGWWWWEGSDLGIDYTDSNGFYYPGEMNDVRASWSTRVTSRSFSNGATWQYTYAPAKTQGTYDATTVTHPGGVDVYKYIGEGYFLATNEWNTNSKRHYFYDRVGTTWVPKHTETWKLGLLTSVNRGGLEEESYTWGSRVHSNLWFTIISGKAGIRSDTTSVATLNNKTITRDGVTHTTTYSNYDAYGNPGTVSESGPNGGSRTRTFTYLNDTTKNIIGVLDDEVTSGGASILRTWDENGRKLSESIDGVKTSWTYTSAGDMATMTKPGQLIQLGGATAPIIHQGRPYTYSNYTRGVAQSETHPESVTVSRTVNVAGHIMSETNGEGHTVSYQRDLMGRVTNITYPKTGTTPMTVAYTANGYTATRGALVETATYDGFGLLTGVSKGGVATSFAYDGLNRKTFESNPGATIGTTYAYDALNRLVRTDNADGTFSTIVYGAGTKTTTNERSKATVHAYRSYGDPEEQYLMSVTAPESSASVTLTRNARNQVSTAVQAGLTRTYGYNSNAYLTSVSDPETGTTTFGRDLAGNMANRVVGASGTTTYVYDGLDRVTRIIYPIATPEVTNTYTKTNKIKTSTSGAATKTFNYDANDNLTGESVVVDGITLNTGYGYNALDQLTSVVYPYSGNTVSYTVDSLGRPTQIAGYVSNVTYWPSGQFQTISYANGTTTSYNQDSRLRPSSFVTQKGTATYLNSSYAYDGVGNLSAVSDTADSSYNRVLGYDNIDRVTSASGSWGAGTIAYTGAGNIESQVFGSSGLYYTYDSSNKLSGVSGNHVASYTYDAYGNIASGASNSYTYDDAPNLLCVNCANSSLKIEYRYDGQNKRVSVTKGGVKTYEVFGSHGNQLSAYTPGTTPKVVEYIYLGDKRIAQRVRTN